MIQNFSNLKEGSQPIPVKKWIDYKRIQFSKGPHSLVPGAGTITFTLQKRKPRLTDPKNSSTRGRVRNQALPFLVQRLATKR